MTKMAKKKGVKKKNKTAVKPKVLIGILTYNDKHFLEESLPVVESLRQELPADVVVLDTAHNNEIKKFVKKEFPKFDYMRHKEGNIGYGRSYNEMLKANPGYDYFLVYTSDVFLDVATVKKFLQRMEKDKGTDKEIAMCAGKLHFWDLKNGRRTNRIDSMGICAEKRHHFYDRGCGEEDSGQYDEVLNDAFGISGAVFLIRTAVVPKLHGSDWQIYDKNMWMYKEDVDLAYRLRWLGEEIKIFPEVWGWHARTVANKTGKNVKSLASADKEKKAYARMHSYQNHFLLLKNNFSFGYGFGVFLRVLFYELLKGSYMLVRHPKVFFAGMKTLLFVRAERSVRCASPKTVLSYFK